MSKVIVTHNTGFHMDDLFAVATLLLIYPDAEVVRTRDEESISKADFVVDTGGVSDAKKGRFDHHQPGGAGERENGIPYASFGLVWREFGERLAGSTEAAQIMDQKLCMPIDALDNGVEIYTYHFDGVKEYTLRDYIYAKSGDPETPEGMDKAFTDMLAVAQDAIRREIDLTKVLVKDLNEVRRIYDASLDKRIIMIPEQIAWKQALIPTEAQFVISERLDGKWGTRAVPAKIGSFEVKKQFPDMWAGKKDEELTAASGVQDAVFCHSKHWLCVAKSKEGALELARKALNA
jgi:uncharacterized UPF0160 family protein